MKKKFGFRKIIMYVLIVLSLLESVCLNVEAMGEESIEQIAAGGGHTVVLYRDGTVSAVGSGYISVLDDNYELIDVNVDDYVRDWENIIQIAAGYDDIYGLKSDGTVLAGFFPASMKEQYDLSEWKNIVQIEVSDAPYGAHIVGLRADGTVIATGSNEDGQCDVDDWTNIVQIAVGTSHTVGLRSDGTVLATGAVYSMQCNVEDWCDIVQISAGGNMSAGLKNDGTVVATGSGSDLHREGEDEVWRGEKIRNWSNIIQVLAEDERIMGLKADGSVLEYHFIDGNQDGQCDVDAWQDIVQIAGNAYHTVGVKRDGTVLAVGNNSCGECNVDSLGTSSGSSAEAIETNSATIQETESPTIQETELPTVQETEHSFKIDENGIITSYSGEGGDVIIPATINGIKVTGIGANAFNGLLRSRITSIVIPKGVTSIGDGAFQDQRNLESISIPDSVRSIGIGVFYNCDALEEVVLPRNLETVPVGLFSYCGKLKTVTFPANMKTISRDLFFDCDAMETLYFTGPCPEEYGNWSRYSWGLTQPSRRVTGYIPSVYWDDYAPLREFYADMRIDWVEYDAPEVSIEDEMESTEEALSEADIRALIIDSAIEKEVEEVCSRFGGIYHYEGDDELTAFERQGYMGFIDSITDAFSVMASVEAGGLIRGQDIVHDIAFEIMQADMSDLSDKMDMLSALTSALSEGKKHTNALINTGHDESVKKLLEAAERSPNAYQFIQAVCDDNDLYSTYEKIRSDKVFMVFGDMTALFDYAQFMRRIDLGVSTASTIISMTNNITDYEIAVEFADLYMDDLRRLRDTTHSDRLRQDLDTYIRSVEGGLVEKIKAYIGVKNTADGIEFTVDSIGAIYGLSKNGFFGESLQKIAQKLTSSEAIQYFFGGLKVASAVADTPSLLMGIFGYDTEEMVKSMDEMNSILPVYKNELDILCDFGWVTEANYQNFEDQYYLCLILGKAWAKSYLLCCNASMNHLEKVGIWTMSDVRKAARNIEGYIEVFDEALQNVSMEYLEVFAEQCPDVQWRIYD